MPLRNHTTADSDTYTDGTYTYTEIVSQEYGGNNCKFSAGFVDGHPVDTVYVRLEKDGVEPTLLLLRPDELAIIGWLATGVLYSLHLDDAE